MRHPLGDGGKYDGSLAKLDALLALLDRLSPATDTSRAVVWRSMTQIEMADGRFNPTRIAEMNAAYDAAWGRRRGARTVINV